MMFIKGFLAALVGSVAANLIALFLLRPLVVDPAMPLHALSVGPVAMLTAIGAIGATIVYAILRALLVHPNKPFIWISAAVLVLSFIPDYLIIGQTTGMFAGGSWPNAAALMFMHIVAAIIIVWSLVWLWGGRQQSAVPMAASAG
jgi:Family of unknown function (DUF6069)